MTSHQEIFIKDFISLLEKENFCPGLESKQGLDSLFSRLFISSASRFGTARSLAIKASRAEVKNKFYPADKADSPEDRLPFLPQGKAPAASCGILWNKIRSQPISRVLSRAIIHLRRTSPRACSDLPRSRADHTLALLYLVLLRAGFTLPLPLPATRCALTAPFHPYRPNPKRSRSYLRAFS